MPLHYFSDTTSRIEVIYASHTILRKVADIAILPRGISDHAPLLLKLSFGPPGERLWWLSRYWVEDIQEAVQEDICNYWLDKVDSTTPLITWDAFKAWTRGECIACISAARRRSAHSLERLEEEAGQKEAAYVAHPDQVA